MGRQEADGVGSKYKLSLIREKIFTARRQMLPIKTGSVFSRWQASPINGEQNWPKEAILSEISVTLLS